MILSSMKSRSKHAFISSFNYLIIPYLSICCLRNANWIIVVPVEIGLLYSLPTSFPFLYLSAFRGFSTVAISINRFGSRGEENTNFGYCNSLPGYGGVYSSDIALCVPEIGVLTSFKKKGMRISRCPLLPEESSMYWDTAHVRWQKVFQWFLEGM